MSDKAKLSISIDEELSATIRAIAAQRQEQISTVVTHALVDYFANEQRRLDGLAAMAEYQHEHGAFTADERRAAAERVDELMGWAPGTGRRQSA
jgi:predicted transcriptional regulator